MLKAIILFVFLATALGGYDNVNSNPFHWWDTDDNKEFSSSGSPKTVPFPKCLLSGSKSKYLQTSNLQNLFDKAIRDEERLAKNEYYENYRKDNDDKIDDDDDDARVNKGKSRAAAAAAIKLTRDIMTKLACDLNGTDSNNLENLLNKFNIAGDFCKQNDDIDCSEKSEFRMPNGLCNNLERPLDGNSHTAFGRLKAADYSDYVSEPRQKSKYGGPLPGCRKVSLAFGSKPVFDRNYNNLFVAFGQYVAHDIALSVPVTDTYYTPVSTCTCDSKKDWNKCTVIEIQPDDPFLRGQKCMAFPATAQAFKNQICSLGIKEQMNGNTHFIDLSGLYGSSVRIADALRGENGLLKSTRKFGTKHELPPGQREGKSCTDATQKRKCFAGGDSRLMITLLFTGVQTIFLRSHNSIAKVIHDDLHPNWISEKVYENARKINIALFQKFFYEDWLKTLLGEKIHKKNFPTLEVTEFTEYDDDVKPVVYNEVATAAFRLHTLIRDLFSRCTPAAKRIDQLWLTDIHHKAKYAYDIENNGIDAILCGALYDYGFAFDGNFAHQIHHRLFEATNQYGQIWRNDLIAINICRGREHGIPTYNTFRKYCNLKKADNFEDLGDTINYEGIKLLKKLYKDVDDIDLFVALNLEDPVDGGLVGPVSQCLLVKQFKDLSTGDRFFYSHKKALTAAQREYVNDLSLACFICLTVDIDEVPKHPFITPTDDDDLQKCDKCKQFDADVLKPLFTADG